MIVDMHNHAVPPGFLDRLKKDARRFGATYEEEDGRPLVRFDDPWGRRLKIFPKMDDLEMRRRHMREVGIEGMVLSAWIDFHRYGLPVEQGVAVCRGLNDAMAEWTDGAPDIRAMATVPLQSGEHAAEELRRAVEDLHLQGAMIMTHINKENLDASHLEPFWEAAEALRTPVFLHPTDVVGKDRLSCYYLTNLLGNPFDTTIAAANLIFSGVLDRHPGLDIVLAHGGGYLSLAAGRLDHGRTHVDGVDFPSRDLPSSYLPRFYYDTVMYRNEALEHLVREAGAERILLGTDYPFNMEPDDAVNALMSLSIPREDVEGILSRAARMYGFGA